MSNNDQTHTVSTESAPPVADAFPTVLDYAAFKKLYPATRVFQKYDHITRSNLASSHRAGHRQREAVGEFFYTHFLCPDRAFDTRTWATEAAYQAYVVVMQSRDALIADLLAACRAAQQFISNGIEFGLIRMPDADTDDPAHKTPDLIRAAIAKATKSGDSPPQP